MTINHTKGRHYTTSYRQHDDESTQAAQTMIATNGRRRYQQENNCFARPLKEVCRPSYLCCTNSVATTRTTATSSKNMFFPFQDILEAKCKTLQTILLGDCMGRIDTVPNWNEVTHKQVVSNHNNHNNNVTNVNGKKLMSSSIMPSRKDFLKRKMDKNKKKKEERLNHFYRVYNDDRDEKEQIMEIVDTANRAAPTSKLRMMSTRYEETLFLPLSGEYNDGENKKVPSSSSSSLLRDNHERKERNTNALTNFYSQCEPNFDNGVQEEYNRKKEKDVFMEQESSMCSGTRRRMKETKSVEHTTLRKRQEELRKK